MSRRRSDTRAYRRSSGSYRGGGRRRRGEPEGGGGGIILIMIGMVLIGGYLLMEDGKLEQVQVWFQGVKETFVEQLVEQGEPQTIPTTVVPCTQAHIAKILAYTLLDVDKIPSVQAGDKWYSKYYEMLKVDTRFQFFDEAKAMQPITYNETLDILKSIAGESYQVEIDETTGLGGQVIALKDFLLAYEQALDFGGIDHGLAYESLSILGTLTTNGALSPWQVATNKGIYGFEGLILDPFKDYTLQVITKKGEILGVVETLAYESIIDQCYVQKVENGKATIQVGALNFEYDAPELTMKDAGAIGKITIKNSMIVDFELQLDKDTDKVLRINEDTIEFQKAGILPYDEVLVYNGVEGAGYNDLKQLFSGIKVSYTLKNGQLETLKVVDDQVGNTMRVVVTEDGLGKYSHDDVVITSETPFTISYKGKAIEVAAQTPWKASEFSWEKSGEKVRVEGTGPLHIQSIVRQGIHPQYKGSIEIYPIDKGYQVVNQLQLEDYVAGVIPSEMPKSYGIEAAKVQAVAARSFALSHGKGGQLIKYGAQVDDTVSTQVYNNVAPDDTSYQAAKDTAGEVLTHNGQMIKGNFFAASCGYTANFGETWANGEIFPTNTPVYLVSRQQYLGDSLVKNMNREEDANAFFKKRPEEVKAFDSKSPWFRWQVQVNGEELSHMVNNNIARLTSQYPNMVKVKNKEGQWVVDGIKSIGDVKEMEITRRGSGGNIMEMVVVGTKETIKVGTEYLVRSLLAPLQMDSAKEPIKVQRADGTEVNNMAMLPSAFFSMEKSHESNGKITEVTFYGGGFGHGVGMSQDGVKGMAEMGYNYKEILSHYYASSKVEKL